MKLIGLCSTYKEGSLVRMAVASAMRACDYVLVAEGPAGEILGADVPDSDFPEGLPVKRGVWKSDAQKRTAMVRATRGYGAGPLWGIWIDGDEVLLQGEFLRDELQAILWRDEKNGGAPTAGKPIRLVEMDGSLAVCRAKCVRLDLISHYIVSSSGIAFKNGQTLVEHAEGNLPQSIREWYRPERVHAIEQDRMMLEPPLPGEPYLLHRSPLRHPSRQGVRMHEQEARELERLGLLAKNT